MEPLDKRIRRAKDQAVSREVIEQKRLREDWAVRQFLERKTTYRDLVEYSASLNLDLGVVVLQNFAELSAVLLLLGVPHETIAQTVESWMRKHGETAELEYPVVFQIQFFSNENADTWDYDIGVYPDVPIDTPDDIVRMVIGHEILKTYRDAGDRRYLH